MDRLGATVLFAAIGFADVGSRSLRTQPRLNGWQRSVAMVVAVLVWAILYATENYPWNMSIPFLKATAPNRRVLLMPGRLLRSLHRFMFARLVECGEPDGRTRRVGDKCDVYRHGSLDGVDDIASDARWAERPT